MEKKLVRRQFQFFSATKEAVKAGLLSLCLYAATDYAHPPEILKAARARAGLDLVFITHWGLYLTIITMGLSYCVRYLNLKFLNGIYTNFLALAIPLEIFVVAAFWAIHMKDPTMLRDKKLYDAGIRTPMVTELSLHVLPLLLLLIDQKDVHLYEKIEHYFLIAVCGIMYFITSYHFFCINKSWAYPFMNRLPTSLCILIVALFIILVMAFYKLFINLCRYKKVIMHV